MKLIDTTMAEGCILCHDITQIIKDVKKGPAFRKGHIVTKEDIPLLLSLGKEHLYVWEPLENLMHENDAAEVLANLCQNDHMERSLPREGKIELTASCDGLFKVDRQRLLTVNGFGQMMIACRHGNTPVKKGDKLAGTRIIPLVIEKDKMERVKALAGEKPLFSLLPYRPKKAAVLVTGSEVYKGRITDTFGPVIRQKLAEYNIPVLFTQILSDDPAMITPAILSAIQERGADLVCCTGGMSVDPDDKTPLAIKNTGARIVTYGAPVLPGAMFLLSYYEAASLPAPVPVLGLPGCVMYARRTIFDLVLPRLLAEDPVTETELAALGEGGLCLNCETCRWPDCGFGKGQ